MNADAIRQGVTVRLSEARELLNHVRSAERPLIPLSPFPAALRGYFFVACYGAVEFAVTEGTQAFINHVKSASVLNGHLTLAMNSVALHTDLMSLEDSGGRRKWDTRRRIFSRLEDSSLCHTPDTAFGTFLHNVWPNTIEEIFRCFGITKSPTGAPAEIGYLKELVEKRNAVSHGRSTASAAGDGQTSSELERTLTSAYNVSLYFLASLEEHAATRAFVREEYRALY